jgi:2',3'-cyclic-nucleotide 2'-phosphodiesterase (5'-nucleotidase family)
VLVLQSGAWHVYVYRLRLAFSLWHVYDAVDIRMTELPITPQKILKALEEKRAAED